ncbi:uncharacterized protein MONOS_2907 [Monocercomonoides exilis]|uniref:uncharacterized protein n=1 Tax=Monocercomonoides exilis TaxID=2049356 RepID=UPI00355939E1|nr:hypothetical protein MONOS_2907 [Monocercomonoides exilis]|eukprot:MONOS_2907.1-p1 / transcript=MONOS_2907.1 / gene=MONOS_2907 / organism=Monocercomonoides_exilis_PA203 / gene_product=unspecified product / transcript_product=unspecified product / location=Mono_scaffold00063:129047-130926(-) / protein_length=559 / sequence_SO=supercontig / SO=protein_coding / is_pseudo=false
MFTSEIKDSNLILCGQLSYCEMVFFIITSVFGIEEFIRIEAIPMINHSNKIFAFKFLFHCLIPVSHTLRAICSGGFKLMCKEINSQEAIHALISAMAGYVFLSCFILIIMHWASLIHATGAKSKLTPVTLVIVALFCYIVPLCLIVPLFFVSKPEVLHPVEIYYNVGLNVLMALGFTIYGLLLFQRMKKLSLLDAANQMKKKIFKQMLVCLMFFSFRAIFLMILAAARLPNVVRLVLSLINTFFCEFIFVIVMLLLISNKPCNCISKKYQKFNNVTSNAGKSASSNEYASSSSSSSSSYDNVNGYQQSDRLSDHSSGDASSSFQSPFLSRGSRYSHLSSADGEDNASSGSIQDVEQFTSPFIMNEKTESQLGATPGKDNSDNMSNGQFQSKTLKQAAKKSNKYTSPLSSDSVTSSTSSTSDSAGLSQNASTRSSFSMSYSNPQKNGMRVNYPQDSFNHPASFQQRAVAESSVHSINSEAEGNNYYQSSCSYSEIPQERNVASVETEIKDAAERFNSESNDNDVRQDIFRESDDMRIAEEEYDEDDQDYGGGFICEEDED